MFFHLGFRAVAETDGGDHRAHANDHAQRGEDGAQLVPPQRAVGNAKCGTDSHGPRESLHRESSVRSVRRRRGRFAAVLRVRTLGHELILPDQPVPHNNVSLRISGDVRLVGDERRR